MAQTPERDDSVVVVGAAAHPLRDAYHLLLKMPWYGVLTTIAVGFLAVNVVFAIGYDVVGGLHGARAGSFRDAFFFSVQTMGTIGYGAMYPVSNGAHALVVAESVVGLIMTALATGIVFARFSQSSGRLVFSERACIGPWNGVPTLTFRIGNDRSNTIVEAIVRVAAIKTERTTEGVLFYKMHDLVLTRERSPALTRSWSVMHPIDEKSPLFGATPESCHLTETELFVTVIGTDDTSMQPVHGRVRYLDTDITWGAQFADVLSELPDGRLRLDLGRFHELVPTKPIDGFPYPKA